MANALVSDPRIRRTRRLLQEAILALAEERDLVDITVRDITERAEVNRATLYLHYRNKEDLVNQALDALFQEVTGDDRAFAGAHDWWSRDGVPPPVLAFVHHLDDRRALYRRLLGGFGANAFADRLRLYEHLEFLRIWEAMGLSALPGSPPADLRAEVAMGIVQATVTWWLERGGEAETPEMMAAWLWHLLTPLWYSATVIATET
ncbi:MAG: TetR/AcrR family transcriptional regulator [Thermomicrobiales bacterium]